MGELIRINKHLEDVRKNRLDSCNKIRIDLKEFGISKKEKKELSKKYKKDYDAYMILDNTILHGISELANILSVIAKKLERMGYPKEEYVGPVKALEQVIDKLRRYGRVVNDDCGIKA
ncbi:hypothetical protein GOV05_01620 [Candidatus Woesearchaeota archaeon]|nr:hypothetical protein [Candidatus Woesearchaeota archaeon]